MDVRDWKCEGQGNLALHVDVFELVLQNGSLDRSRGPAVGACALTH